MDEKARDDAAAVRSGVYLGGRAGIPGQGPFLALVLKVDPDSEPVNDED